MRLIDADALIEELEADAEHIEDSISKMVHYAIIKDIEDMPTIDAVEVVRCRECKFYQPYDYHRKYDCSRGLLGVMGDDYCSHGERRG